MIAATTHPERGTLRRKQRAAERYNYSALSALGFFMMITQGAALGRSMHALQAKKTKPLKQSLFIHNKTK